MKKDYLFNVLSITLPTIEKIADNVSKLINNNWPKDFVHNNIVHPSMSFMFSKNANIIHDNNATWAFGLERFDELKLETKK